MTINLPLEPLGIIPVTGSIQVLIEGVGENWNINSDCFDEKLVCQFEEISQNNRGVLEILISDNNLDIMTPVQLRFIIDSGDTRLEHIMVLKYDGITSPDPLWHRDSELPNEKICIAIEVIENQSGNLSVTENPFWSIEDSSFLTSGNNELCLVSEKGGWESLDLVSSGIQGSRMAPIVTFQQDNGNITTWELPIDNSYIGIYFNQTRGMNLGQQISGILFSDTFGSPFCPSSVMIPTLDSDSEENFTLSSGSPLIINGNYDGRSLLLPETGWLVNCKENESIAMILKPGFDIDIDDLLLNDSRLPLSDFIINSRSEQNISLVLDISSNIRSDDALNISVPNTILSNSSVNININLDEISDGAWRVFWISQDSDSLILHFVSKCPIGGCLN